LKRFFFVLFLLAAAAPARAADDPLGAAANTAFLADDARKPGTVVQPSGLHYRVLRRGFGGRAGPNDVVRINYSVRLIDGRLVDGSTPSLPPALAISTLSLRGLSEALQLMHVGDHWQVVVPANLAFGVKGSANGAIPPGQTLIFDLTLLEAAAPRPGEAPPENPFSVWSNGRENGAAFTFRP
jgi:FKBP-type peptidyl-prolyl cis-trans isomerase